MIKDAMGGFLAADTYGLIAAGERNVSTVGIKAIRYFIISRCIHHRNLYLKRCGDLHAVIRINAIAVAAARYINGQLSISRDNQPIRSVDTASFQATRIFTRTIYRDRAVTFHLNGQHT